CTMLTAVQAQSVTLFLDANFNGVQRDGEYLFPVDEKKSKSSKSKKNRGLRIRGDVVVFCSSDFTATSYAFKEQEHGFFTYFLLKELKKTKGNLSYDDMFTNVKEAVSFESSLQGLQQIPTMITGGKTKDTWTTMSFK
ncbi:MAG: caspase family protein, partial [Bacteroidales bacterium]|nr:caspase family protein [Bacteroidales bacterium]